MLNQQDQRIFERFTARFPTKFKDSRNDFGTNVFLRDASASGAKIITKERLYLHDVIALTVELPDGHGPLSLKGKVVRVKSQQPRLWDVGIEFQVVDLMCLQRLFRFCQ